MERRDFLLLLATAAVARPWSAPPIHLTFIGGDDDARRGAEMSAEEVKRAAAMFGRSVVYDVTAGPKAGDRLRVTFDDAGDPVFFHLRGTPVCERNRFYVHPQGDLLAWHPTLTRFGADTLNKRYRARFHAAMSSDAWCGWFAVKCAWEAALKSNAATTASLIEYLEQPTTRFDGHKGVALSFNAAHRLQQPVYNPDASEAFSFSVEERCAWK